MNKKIRFFHSIHFKIALVFILVVVVTVEVIGAYFVKQLEQQNIDSFKSQITIETYVEDKVINALEESNTTKADRQIRNALNESSIVNSADIQVVDAKGVLRGDSNVNSQTVIGQKKWVHSG